MIMMMKSQQKIYRAAYCRAKSPSAVCGPRSPSATRVIFVIDASVFLGARPNGILVIPDILACSMIRVTGGFAVSNRSISYPALRTINPASKMVTAVLGLVNGGGS
jgi:hypothetical protein